MSQPPLHTTDHDADPTIPPPPSTRRLRVVRISTIVAVLVAVGAAFYFRDRIQELKQYGYAAIFLVGLVSNATLILPVPGLVISSVMGGVFNPWIVGLVGGVGQALGELTGYMAGYSGQTWIDENPTYNRMTQWMQRYGILTIFVLALIPNPIFDLGGIAAGALRLPLWKFLASSIAGKVVKNIIFALGGYYGIEVLLRLFGG
jgi:membrane protein YqaA with SNARE-associated domain